MQDNTFRVFAHCSLYIPQFIRLAVISQKCWFLYKFCTTFLYLAMEFLKHLFNASRKASFLCKISIEVFRGHRQYFYDVNTPWYFIYIHHVFHLLLCVFLFRHFHNVMGIIYNTNIIDWIIKMSALLHPHNRLKYCVKCLQCVETLIEWSF